MTTEINGIPIGSGFDPPSRWAEAAWLWAWKNNLANEKTDPHDTMTKQEMLVILHRYNKRVASK